MNPNNKKGYGETMNDHEPRKVYQICRFCGRQFGTRGIKNHEKKCEKLHANAQGPPEEQPTPQEQEEPLETPQKPKLALLKPLTPKEPPETETVEEIKTLSGDAIKIIKNVAPKVEPNAPLASETSGLTDLMKQAEMIGNVNEIVKTDGVQAILSGLANLANASAEKLRGAVTQKTATDNPQLTPEEEFLIKFANGEI